jgi:hypothetical protein
LQIRVSSRAQPDHPPVRRSGLDLVLEGASLQDLVLDAPPAPHIESTARRTSRGQRDQFRGTRIHLCNLAGLEIRDCEANGLKIVDCYGSDVYLGGDFERLIVNDVDAIA